MPERSTIFGEVAETYEDVRPGYGEDLVEAVFDAAPALLECMVEIGAGTGKATAAFAGRGVPIICLEPDARMADVLRRRFAEDPQVSVEVTRFEDWVAPMHGVPLLFSAQAWHWVDPDQRCRLAYGALSPGGLLALFAHKYNYADAVVERALDRVYAEHAPQLLDGEKVVGAPEPPPQRHRLFVETAGSDLFVDVRGLRFSRRLAYPTARYLQLVATFSPHRALPAAQRAALLGGIGAAVDAHGGVLEVRLDTTLVLARRDS